MSPTEKALAHIGVRGMKWGVRKDRTPLGPSEVATKIVTTRSGVRVVTSGGKHHPPSDDAIKAAIAIQKARASSTASLTNSELQQAVQRMDLETKYAKAMSSKAPRGNPAVAFVGKVLKEAAKEDITKLVKGQDTKYIGELLGVKGTGTSKGKHSADPSEVGKAALAKLKARSK